MDIQQKHLVVLLGLQLLLVVDGGEGGISMVVAVLEGLLGQQLLIARLQGVALGRSVVQHLSVTVGVVLPKKCKYKSNLWFWNKTNLYGNLGIHAQKKRLLCFHYWARLQIINGNHSTNYST